MVNHRIRIFLSLLVAFIIINLYGRLSKTPYISSIQAGNIKSLLSNIKFNPNSLIKFFSLKIKFPESNQLKPLKHKNENINFTHVSPIPTQPCTGVACLTPTKYSQAPTPTGAHQPISTPLPTSRPQPTVPSKPTATPAPPPVTSDIRPGSTLREIFQEVNKRMCIPVALLMAFQYEESGVFFDFDNPPSVIKIYNSYGWWKTGAGDPCFGLGYHSQTGIVPPDSVRAGDRCRNAVGNSADQGIMGIIQIGQGEQDVSRKNTIGILPNNIDRRVLFDNAIIFASITKNRVGSPPSDCDDWPEDVIRIAAQKHHGVCQYDYGNGPFNYCDDIVRLYKQYK